MAAHSSILAWRIPWTEEPGRLQSMGLQKVRHNWNDWAQHKIYFSVLNSSWDQYFSFQNLKPSSFPLQRPSINWVCASFPGAFSSHWPWCCSFLFHGVRLILPFSGVIQWHLSLVKKKNKTVILVFSCQHCRLGISMPWMVYLEKLTAACAISNSF